MKKNNSSSGGTGKTSLRSAMGGLWEHYSDTGVRDIFVDAFDRVSVERKGRLEAVPSPFASAAALAAFIKKLAAYPGCTVRRGGTVLDIKLPDRTRVTCALGEAYQAVVISKVPSVVFGWDELVKHGCLPEEGRKLFEAALGEMKSVLVAGASCSGKTTTIEVLANGIPAARRVVAVQGASELALRHPAGLSLDAATDEEFVELLKRAENFLPDYLVVDSLEGVGVPEVVRAMRNGLAVIASCHADSALDALKRLEYMYLASKTAFGLDEIRSMLASGLGYVSFQERGADGHRRVVEFSRVDGYEDGRYILTPLLKYSGEAAAFELTPAGKAMLKK